MLGLKRKKSAAVLGKANTNETLSSQNSSSTNVAQENLPESLTRSGLTAGMPMGPLSKEESKLLLPDLPVLQKIWLETAEAMILDRKIVDRPSHIRRNAHVLTELIREDCLEDEDQWLYGTLAPESVRPNLDAIEEDPLE